MVAVSKEIAIASEDGKDCTANSLTASILHALVMALVYLVSATARQGGKAMTVVSSISKYINVFQPVPIMALTI